MYIKFCITSIRPNTGLILIKILHNLLKKYHSFFSLSDSTSCYLLSSFSFCYSATSSSSGLGPNFFSSFSTAQSLRQHVKTNINTMLDIIMKVVKGFCLIYCLNLAKSFISTLETDLYLLGSVGIGSALTSLYFSWTKVEKPSTVLDPENSYNSPSFKKYNVG